LAAIDNNRAVVLGSEPELHNGREASLAEYRLPPPCFAAVVGDQKKRILRERMKMLARDPAGLEIDELNLVETRAGGSAPPVPSNSFRSPNSPAARNRE
jgi:hypothetical protein